MWCVLCKKMTKDSKPPSDDITASTEKWIYSLRTSQNPVLTIQNHSPCGLWLWAGPPMFFGVILIKKSRAAVHFNL